jgi:SAM-dependent methyltransferase
MDKQSSDRVGSPALSDERSAGRGETPALQNISNLMEETLEREGETVLGVGYRSRENQALRFSQILRLIDRDTQPFSVNDLGCGFADLYGFIRGRQLPMRLYRGYDLSEKMLAVAAKRVGPDAELIQADRVTESADYSFACGVFNARLEAAEDEWLAYMKSVVHNLQKHSTRGFAFNSLTTYVDWREDHLFYVDPMEMFRFCKEEISPRVALLHDYPLWEWTILVRTELDSPPKS